MINVKWIPVTYQALYIAITVNAYHNPFREELINLFSSDETEGHKDYLIWMNLKLTSFMKIVIILFPQETEMLPSVIVSCQ